MPHQIITIAAHGGMLLLFFMVLGWLLGYEEHQGFGFSGKGLFNWHPLLMTLGFGVFIAEGVIGWSWIKASHRTVKLLHSLCHLAGVVCTVLGLTAVIVFHETMEFPHFKSVHSWIGLTTMTVVVIQLVVSSVVFGTGLVGVRVRQMFVDHHRAVGIFVYVIALIAIATGLMQLQSFLRGGEKSGVVVFANGIALVVLLNALLILYHISRPVVRKEEERLVGGVGGEDSNNDSNASPQSNEASSTRGVRERIASPE